MANLFNFDDVQEVSFISEAGSYTVKIKDVERKDSKAGNPMDVYTLETQDKQIIRHYLTLSEKALFKYKEFIRAVNKIEGSVGVVDLDAFPTSTIGKKVVIEVKIEDVERFNPETSETETTKMTRIHRVLPLNA